MGGEDDCGEDAAPRIGHKRKVEAGWLDVTQEQRKCSMQSNPPPFEYRWTDATKAAVNAALAAYSGSHMCVLLSSIFFFTVLLSTGSLRAIRSRSAGTTTSRPVKRTPTHHRCASLRRSRCTADFSCSTLHHPTLILQVDSVFELEGVQFCSLVVHGQSFM